MARPIYFDRVKDTSTTTGTGTLTITGTPPVGSQPFSLVGTNPCPILIYSADFSQWEVQQASVFSSNTLTRGTPLASSNSGALVNFTLPLTIELVGPSSSFQQFQDAALSGPNSQISNYTLALSDLGGIVILPSSAVAAITVTIPPMSSVAWPTAYGSLSVVPSIYIINQNSTYNITVAQGTGVTLNRRDGLSGTGSRTIGTNSEAQIKFYGSNNWDISGSSLS